MKFSELKEQCYVAGAGFDVSCPDSKKPSGRGVPVFYHKYDGTQIFLVAPNWGNGKYIASLVATEENPFVGIDVRSISQTSEWVSFDVE